MSNFVVSGGQKLSGKIHVQGSKNASFPVIAAAILTDEICVIENVPDISDVRNFLSIMEYLGAKVEFRDHLITIDPKNLTAKKLPQIIMKKLRGSILFAGPLLGRFGKVDLAFPGGDAIGKRAIDVHLDGFRKLGAVVREDDMIHIQAERLAGNDIVLGVTTVTGTENLILASVLAPGTTHIKIAAAEPHVQHLCKCLVQMGAQIEGIGTPYLKINGVKRLTGFRYRLMGDELEAITFAVAAAATRSELEIGGVDLSTMDAPLAALERMKVNFCRKDGNILKVSKQKEPYKGTRIITGVYPQLLTDYQPLFGVLATQAEGKTNIHDWIYEGRQEYLKALQKMGARIEYDDVHRARIYGPTDLHGAEIKTPDIRAGASILIAALIARGESTIYNAEIIDRGYELLDERMRSIGANIERVE